MTFNVPNIIIVIWQVSEVRTIQDPVSNQSFCPHLQKVNPRTPSLTCAVIRQIVLPPFSRLIDMSNTSRQNDLSLRTYTVVLFNYVSR